MTILTDRLFDQTPSISSWFRAAFVTLLSIILTFIALRSQYFLTAAVGPIVIGPIPTLFSIVGLLAGPLAVIGCTLSYLGYHWIHGLFPIWSGAEYLILGVLTHLFWRNIDSSENRNILQFESSAQLRNFLAATVPAAAGSATFTAWGYEITGNFPFFPTVIFVAISQILAIIIGGSIVFGVLTRIFAKYFRQLCIRKHRQSITNEGASLIPFSSLLLFIWITLGSLVSIGVQIIELVPPFHVRLRGLDPVLLFKSSGTMIQIGLGVTILSMWLFSQEQFKIITKFRDWK